MLRMDYGCANLFVDILDIESAFDRLGSRFVP